MLWTLLCAGTVRVQCFAGIRDGLFPGGVVQVWSSQGVRDMLQTLEFRRRSDGCCRDQERTIVAVEQRFPLSLVGRCLGAFFDVYGRLQLRGDVCPRFTTSDGASQCSATRSHVWRRLATCVDISRARCCRPSFWIYLGQGAGSTPVLARGDVCRRVTILGGASHCSVRRSYVRRRLATSVEG